MIDALGANDARIGHCALEQSGCALEAVREGRKLRRLVAGLEGLVFLELDGSRADQLDGCIPERHGDLDALVLAQRREGTLRCLGGIRATVGDGG
jgi:hypothetical protein